jgi:hypothetical protein
MKSNLIQIVFGWSPSKIVCVDPINYPRWPPWPDYATFGITTLSYVADIRFH